MPPSLARWQGPGEVGEAVQGLGGEDPGPEAELWRGREDPDVPGKTGWQDLGCGRVSWVGCDFLLQKEAEGGAHKCYISLVLQVPRG